MASLPTAFDTQASGIAALPMPPTPLLGRDRELAVLVRLLEPGDVRLVTLTGPGGVGKTRLAIAAATHLLDRSAGSDALRAMFVPLAAVATPDQVIPTIARALDVRDDPGAAADPVRGLATRLGDAPLLLVLDNMEQVVAAAPSLSALLSACPRLLMLVTSRLPLHLRGEREFPVEPLTLPTDATASLAAIAASQAVQLFVETAQRVRPAFELTEDNATIVADVCRRLDGLPLAIELAAARMKVLSVSALLARLANRLSILTGGARDLPDRQQTLRDTIAWSYHLLTPPEQNLFRRMSVFAGGASLGAVEAIANGEGERGGEEGGDGPLSPSPSLPPSPSVLDVLTSLVDHSLLRQEVRDNEPRLVMLETIREFARERLVESGVDGPARDRHAAWCLALTNAAVRRLAGSEQSVWLERLDLEGDNIRAALDWLGTNGDPVQALHLATVLWRYWEIRGQLREARTRLEAALDRAGEEATTLRARALNNLGNVLLDMGEQSGVAERYEASLAMRRQLGDREGAADTLNNLGLLDLARGDLAAARTQHEESLAIRRELDDPWGIALSLSNLGDIANAAGDYAAAWDLHQEALAIRRGLGEPRAIGYSTNNLGESAFGRGDLTLAAELFQAALDRLHAVGDRSGEALVLQNIGAVALQARDFGDAARALAAAYRLRVELQDQRAAADTVALIIQVATAAGEAGLATTLQESLETTLGPGERRQSTLGGLVVELANRLAANHEASIPAVTAPAQPDPLRDLTPREREVIRLVAEGRTDRDIGDELFITTRTASTHVTNILGKLALPSRTAAAAWAIRHGLK